MPTIRQLDPHVADLIAAGEVVERPASVVKELMENAIDAGASSVTVEILRGGMSYIRVTDDGCGIAPDEVETAFLRHATSKIRDEFDLEAIGTLGFRGEALAAIAAVSQVEILTRQKENDFGVALLLDGGNLRTREEAGGPVGTTMIVRNLFFNTPARLKFMKRDASEGAAVFAVVQHIALSHPEVAVRFLKEEKEELRTPGDGKLKSALYAVLGRDIAMGFTPVKGGNEEVQVEGFVSLPACCRGTRGYQNFFVNGRYVKSRAMTAALEEAYRNQKMVGKFPGCVLHITVKLNGVDVNVHPTKTEVKFLSDKKLFDGIYYAVRDALEQNPARPQMTVGRTETKAAEKLPPKSLEAPAPPAAKPAASAPVAKKPAAPVGGASFASSYPGKENFFRTMSVEEYRAAAKSAPKAPAKPEGKAVSAPEIEETLTMSQIWEKEMGAAFRRMAGVVPESPGDALVFHDGGKADYQAARPEASDVLLGLEEREEPVVEEAPELVSAPVAEPVQETIALPVSEPAAAAEVPAPEEELPWRVVGEAFHTYILVEQGDTLLLIDKHAAHERMNFDRLKAADWRPMAQQLLTPLVLRPGQQEGEVLLAHAELLEEFGFELEDFGDGAILVRQVPHDIEPGQAESTLGELAGKLMTTGRLDPSSARDDLLHTIACKAAIKGGQKNGPQELEKVARAVMNDEVRYCPHGRPVAIELTKKQLEKQFKRS